MFEQAVVQNKTSKDKQCEEAKAQFPDALGCPAVANHGKGRLYHPFQLVDARVRDCTPVLL